MKPELTNLLDRLLALMDGFQGLIVFPNGRAMALFRHGSHPFADLTELEDFAYSRPGVSLPCPVPSHENPLAPTPPQPDQQTTR